MNTSSFVVNLHEWLAASDNPGMAERKATVRTTVLLPADLHAALKVIADRDRRSLHREIIFALEQFAGELSGGQDVRLSSGPGSDPLQPRQGGRTPLSSGSHVSPDTNPSADRSE